MEGFNRISMIGSLVEEPELKKIKDWDLLAFRLASVSTINRKNAEPMKETCYIDVSLFGMRAADMFPLLHKGTEVHVDGRLKLDSWVNKEGQKQSKHCIKADNIIVVEENSPIGGGLVTSASFEQPFE